MISGKTTVIAHLGYPTFAFKAPMIYNPWFDKNDIDAVVVPMGVKPEEYREFFPLLFKMSNIRGALVTMPHKVVTTELVDELTPIAQVAGAANAVLVREDGSLLGDQFDGAGFARGVARKGFDVKGKSALVVGNGGVGSPIAASLVADGHGPHRPVRPVHRGLRGARRAVEQALPGRRGDRRIQGPGRLRPGGQRDPDGDEGRRPAADGHRPDRADHLRRRRRDEAGRSRRSCRRPSTRAARSRWARTCCSSRSRRTWSSSATARPPRTNCAQSRRFRHERGLLSES